MEQALETFGSRLRRARERRGLTVLGLADQARLSPRSIERYEAGHNDPRIEVAVRLADALGVSLDYLAGLESA